MSGRNVFTFTLLLQIFCSCTVWSMRLPSDRDRLDLRNTIGLGEEDGFQTLVDFEECVWTKCSTFQDIDLRRICLSLCQKLSSKPGFTKRSDLDKTEHHKIDKPMTAKPKEDYQYRRQLHNVHSCIESLCSNKASPEYHLCVIEKCYGHLHFGRSLDQGRKHDNVVESSDYSVDSYPMISDTFLESRKVILPSKRGWNDENRSCLKSCGGVNPLSLDYDICIQKCKR